MKKQINQTFIPIFGVVLLAVGGVILMSVIFFKLAIPQNTGDTRKFIETQNPLITTVDSGQITKPDIHKKDYLYGNPNAPVTIFEFSDFACPYCQVMAVNLKKLINKNPDVVNIVWKDFPITSLHETAGAAHVAAYCAGEQGKFWEYHDLLFQSQDNLNRTTYLKLAQNLKLKPNAFASCLDDPKSTTQILQNVQDGYALGVDGTPYLFINDQRISGLVSEEELQQTIDLHKKLPE